MRAARSTASAKGAPQSAAQRAEGHAARGRTPRGLPSRRLRGSTAGARRSARAWTSTRVAAMPRAPLRIREREARARSRRRQNTVTAGHLGALASEPRDPAARDSALGAPALSRHTGRAASSHVLRVSSARGGDAARRGRRAGGEPDHGVAHRPGAATARRARSARRRRSARSSRNADAWRESRRRRHQTRCARRRRSRVADVPRDPSGRGCGGGATARVPASADASVERLSVARRAFRREGGRGGPRRGRRAGSTRTPDTRRARCARSRRRAARPPVAGANAVIARALAPRRGVGPRRARRRRRQRPCGRRTATSPAGPRFRPRLRASSSAEKDLVRTSFAGRSGGRAAPTPRLAAAPVASARPSRGASVVQERQATRARGGSAVRQVHA